MATLVEQFGKMKQLNSLIVKHNEFSDLSFAKLAPILTIPNNLLELKLVATSP